MGTIIDTAGQTLGGFIPRLGGALALLIIGLLLARLIGRLLIAALRRANVDELAERGGVHDVLARAGLGHSLAHVLGVAVRMTLTIVVVFAALSLMGLQFLSQSLNQGILALPKLLIAAALVLAGVVTAGWVRGRIDRLAYQLDLPIPLGYLAQVTVVAIFVITAAAQIAISTALLAILLGVLVAGVCATFALAFGLGGRDVARELSAGRHIRSTYSLGQEISVGDVRGRITALEAACTVLEVPGRTLRVPNHVLLDSIVSIHESRQEPAQ